MTARGRVGNPERVNVKVELVVTHRAAQKTGCGRVLPVHLETDRLLPPA